MKQLSGLYNFRSQLIGQSITISDSGIGMTAEEIEKYINQIAFSGAEEFVEKYKDSTDTQIIGHFGLGFYSAYMVAHTVEIKTLSYQEGAKAAQWKCTGNTEFELGAGKRKTRGTDIILHIAEDSLDFLQKWKINELLTKYCKFLPVEIEFDEKVINNTNPIWKKAPADISLFTMSCSLFKKPHCFGFILMLIIRLT